MERIARCMFVSGVRTVNEREGGTYVFWIFAITLTIVGLYIGRWIVRERDTIVVYHDRLVAACDEDEQARERREA